MKTILPALALCLILAPALAAEPAPGPEPTVVELQLRDLEHRVDALYASIESFNKGVTELASKNPQLQKLSCTGLRGTLPNSLKDVRAIVERFEKTRPQMSDEQMQRLLALKDRLAQAPTDVPACVGIK